MVLNFHQGYGMTRIIWPELQCKVNLIKETLMMLIITIFLVVYERYVCAIFDIKHADNGACFEHKNCNTILSFSL